MFPIKAIRKSFPALKRAGENFIFFDNAAGAQMPKQALDAVAEHLLLRNVQRGGPYRQSREVDESIAHARESVAIFLNARQPEEVCFGMNATSFIRLVSMAIGQKLRASRSEIIVTDLDHESNIATWLALRPNGAKILWWRMRQDGRLHAEDLDALLSKKTRLVACPLASNSLGSILDVAEVSKRARAAGAEVFVDCVHYGPHGPVDVQALDCDYLVCSGYKIFGPHMGFLWGRKHLLDALPTFREDFIPDTAPSKFEVGTYVYENVAGMDAAIAYLESLGKRISPHTTGRRAVMLKAMDAIRDYEAALSEEFLKALASIDTVATYGITDPALSRHRTPTFCFNVKNKPASHVAERLAKQGIAVRNGNMYSPRVMKHLKITSPDGAIRASLVHYNTADEIHRFARALHRMVKD
jgi:cysteine desulfurase family protein (TIGR01976 family)